MVTEGGSLGSYLLPEFVIVIAVICPFLIDTEACACVPVLSVGAAIVIPVSYTHLTLPTT